MPGGVAAAGATAAAGFAAVDELWLEPAPRAGLLRRRRRLPICCSISGV
jgi:hypothetical protein